jgi:hypothetical protein
MIHWEHHERICSEHRHLQQMKNNSEHVKEINYTSYLESLNTAIREEYVSIRKDVQTQREEKKKSHETQTTRQKELESTKKAARTLHKIQHWIGRLDPNNREDFQQLCASSRDVEKNDHSITTKIARLNRKLCSLRNGQYYVTPLNDITEWGKKILETKSKAANRKRPLTRQIRDERIKKQVQRIIDSFAGEPRKFYRKIQQAFSTNTTRLTALRNKQGRASAKQEEINHVIEEFYTNLFANKTKPNREEYRKWLNKLSPSEHDKNNATEKITYKEVHSAIKELANNKATGLDEIPAEVYKVLADINDKQVDPDESNIFISTLTSCFNAYMINSKPIPDSWRTSVMILLYKGGDKLDIANFRPITLISVMYKTYAAILAKRLLNFVERNNALSSAQAGFRKQRGPHKNCLQ